jgi:hypothetical protein
MPQQQSENFAPTISGDNTDVVWLNRQHGLLLRRLRPSDSYGRFDLILRDGVPWAVIGTTRLLPVKDAKYKPLGEGLSVASGCC